ncbi:hypothetical protein BDR07DRAFT_1394645 [Suillus spraguei]|nr:hypothetical protein BDR07DRAFT_1394645 [Suillus spraguei]
MAVPTQTVRCCDATRLLRFQWIESPVSELGRIAILLSRRRHSGTIVAVKPAKDRLGSGRD